MLLIVLDSNTYRILNILKTTEYCSKWLNFSFEKARKGFIIRMNYNRQEYNHLALEIIYNF